MGRPRPGSYRVGRSGDDVVEGAAARLRGHALSASSVSGRPCAGPHKIGPRAAARRA